MKKGLLAAMLGILLFSTTSLAKEDLTTKGQVMISLGHSFWDKQWLVGYAEADALMATDSYMALFTYLGPQIKVTKKFNVYLLGGTFNDNFGMSALTSIWLDYVIKKNDFFAEMDHYPPINGHPPIMFVVGQYSLETKDNTGLGIRFEAFGPYEAELYELAYGPFFKAGKLRFWVAYDSTPDTPGESVFVRVFLSP